MLKHGSQSSTYIAGGTQTTFRSIPAANSQPDYGTPNNKMNGTDGSSNVISARFTGVVT